MRMVDILRVRHLFRPHTLTINEVRPYILSLRESDWSDRPSSYSQALLQQYVTYVEMADRVSARRALTNTFFLSLNSAVFVSIGVLWEHSRHVSDYWLTFPLVGLLGQCLSWHLLLRSFRQLNSAKYVVIGALEAHLPASPYWQAEWHALGRGQDAIRYLPATRVEQWIPTIFAVTYVSAFIMILMT